MVDEMRALLFEVHNEHLPQVYTPIPPKIQVFTWPTFFPTSKPIDRTGSVSSLPPKINHVGSVVSSGVYDFRGTS